MARPLPTVTRWTPLAQKYGSRFNIPTNVLLGLIHVESSGNPNAVSPAGARGVTQFLPSTARGYKVKLNDPASEIRGAAQYLRDLGFSKNPLRALGAYNGGPGNPQMGYARSVMGAASLYGSGNAKPGHVPIGSPSPSTLPEPSVSLVQALRQPQGFATAPPPPAFSAQASMPQGYQPSPGTPRNADPRQGLTQLLSPASDIPLPAPGPSPSGTPGLPGVMPKRIGAGITGRPGKIIGTPYAGTHAKAFNVQGGSDNWQSENAVDIAIPVGTPVYAFENGVLGNTGSLGMGGRFSGLRTNLIGKGNSFYYAHLSKLAPGIHAGAHVKQGQLLGYSGSANGVAHLHFAVQRGNPATYARLRRR